MKIDLGIDESKRAGIAKGLSRVLADSYTLYLKTHNFHWNVRGSMFAALHTMFETQYNELALAVDELAERIRSLGEQAPGSYTEFSELTVIKESIGRVPWKEMVVQLAQDHETVAKTARSVFPEASKAEDEATVDLLTQRLQIHEKTAWMLRSILDE